MKIVSIITGLLIVVLMVLFFTGAIPFDGGINELIIKGNRAYAANNYEQALQTYQKGLEENSTEPRLNYNLGQTSYKLSKYNEAINYYSKTSGTVDKYINSGNSSLRLAESIDDAVQKQQFYQQALETYKQGILAFPQNVPLKYNYEYVKSKLDNQQNQNNEEQDESQENKDEQENNQNEQGNNSEQNQQNEDSSENNQNKDSEQKDSEENQQSSQEEKNDEQDKEGSQQNEAQEDADSKEQNASQMQESDSSNTDQSDSNIVQILKMLEKQEQESLKNNQEVKSSAKEDEYDW